MAGNESQESIEVWLILDDDGVAVRVYSHGDRLADSYHAQAVSMEAAQAEITAHYTGRGYEPEGGWQPQQWTTEHTGYGEVIHESSRRFHWPPPTAV